MADFYSLTPQEQAERFSRLGTEALRRWNIERAELSLIKMRENAVFRVDTPRGERFALRIHRHNYHSDAALRSELQWMRALEAEGIDVPVVVPTAAGTLFDVVKSDGVPEPRQVDLFEWIEGAQLGSSGQGLVGDPDT
ncbi:MAG: phosphotransferase enzyme family protein, partial [Gammaproteobacteria bacterium]